MSARGCGVNHCHAHQPTLTQEVTISMVRALARSRAFPVIAWAYLAALTVQVFFAGMFVFVGPGNIELHRNMAHVIGLLTILLIASAFVGRVPEKRLVFGILGLLVVQGMLVHLNQWFGLSVIAALHPVNALVLSYASLSLAKRSTAYWTAGAPQRSPAAVAPSGAALA
jgi:heme A synthase